MRLVLTLSVLGLGSACSFYAPSISDCTISCGDDGACPTGFTCRGAFCRPTKGEATDCACRAGAKQKCGSTVGECKEGEQTCSAGGAWSGCVGGHEPTTEICDGKDNDCDGLTDLGQVKVILENNTGPFEGFWRLHGHDGGYTMVTPLAVPDGGAEVRALRYDADFTPLGQSAPIVAGNWRRTDSAAEGSTIYVGYYRDLDVELSRVTADGVVKVIGTVLDAGYDGRMQVGVGPLGVVSTWLTTDPSVRVAQWRVGAAPIVKDLLLPGVNITWLDATTDGQFVIIEGDGDDGGVVDAVHRIDELTPRTTAAPYYRSARFMTRRSGQVVHLDILDVAGNKVIFWRDFATQANDAYMVVEETGRWHDSDFVLDDDESLVAAYVNEDTQRFVLARIEGTTSSDQQVTRFVPPDDVVIPISTASGNVRVAKVPGDPMFGLAWSTRTRVLARRFCAP